MSNLLNNKIYFLILFIFAISCNPDKKKETIRNDNVYTVDFDNIPKEEKIPVSYLFKKVTPIPLETTDESLIGYINEVQVFDGKIFVLDKSYAYGVFMFDMDGKFIRKFGRTGQGPGEYLYLTDFTIDEINKEIYLLDRDNNCVFIYDIDTGKYKRRIKFAEIKYSTYVQYSNGRLYVDANRQLNSGQDYLLHEIDIATGKYKSSWLDADIYNRGWMNTTFFNGVFYSRNHTNTPKYMQLLMDTVFSIEKDGITPFLTVRSNKWALASDAKKVKELSAKPLTAWMNDYNRLYSISDFIEGKDIILFNVYEGDRRWYILCDHRNGTKNIRIGEFLINDLLFEEDKYAVWKTRCSDEKGIYAILPIEWLNLMDVDKEVKKDLPNRERLLNLKEDDNPVILYFEYE
jgi:hypothetical protein